MNRDIFRLVAKCLIIGENEYVEGIKRQGSSFDNMVIDYAENVLSFSNLDASDVSGNIGSIESLKKQFEEDPQRMRSEVEAEILRRMGMNEKVLLQKCLVVDMKVDPNIFTDWAVRRAAYRALGWTTKAFDDEKLDIRREAYRALSWTPKAFDDSSWGVRIEAYRALGWTIQAFEDSDIDIRMEAKKHFDIKARFEEDPRGMNFEVKTEILRRL